MYIVFVCLGNICRSPMAEYLAKQYLNLKNIKNITIESYGTANYHEGSFMHEGTDMILTNLNIYHDNFKSKQINKKVFDNADYIIVMDNSNYQNIINKFGKSDKIFKLTNYCTLGYDEVPDPWYTTNFKLTYEIINNSIENFFKTIL